MAAQVRGLRRDIARESALPLRSDADWLTVDVEQGRAAGVLLDSRMEEVLAVWGLPDTYSVSDYDDVGVSYARQVKFRFAAGRLVGIELSDLPNAKFALGPRLDRATEQDIRALFGAPDEVSEPFRLGDSATTTWTWRQGPRSLEITVTQDAEQSPLKILSLRLGRW